MIRDILFRGKRIDNGEWIEGSLLQVTLNGKTAHLIFGDNFSFVGNDVTALSHALVDPDTVGQYTGLTDKNGKKIFEGDILQRTYMGGTMVMDGAIIAEYWNCSCCDGVFGFGIDGDVDLRDHEDCEIIGTIHDNPELRKAVRD